MRPFRVFYRGEKPAKYQLLHAMGSKLSLHEGKYSCDFFSLPMTCLLVFLCFTPTDWIILLTLNQNKPCGLSHPYQLDESTFNLRGIRSNFKFFHLIFRRKSSSRLANRIAPENGYTISPSIVCLKAYVS